MLTRQAAHVMLQRPCGDAIAGALEESRDRAVQRYIRPTSKYQRTDDFQLGWQRESGKNADPDSGTPPQIANKVQIPGSAVPDPDASMRPQ